MKGDTEEPFYLEGESRPAHFVDLPYALLYMVEPAYSQIMQVRVLRGRFLTYADNERASPVVAIDEAFAERYFGGADPIGKHLYRVDPITGEERAQEVVGVVGHVRQWGLADDSIETLHAQVYQPWVQVNDRRTGLMARYSHVYLRTKPGPTEVELREFLAGHLCRCTGYVPIVKAALDAAEGVREASHA